MSEEFIAQALHFETSLEAISQLCEFGDWDLQRALPVAPETIENARRFISALPVQFHHLDIRPEPDGSIALSWDLEAIRGITVRVEPSAPR